MARPTKSVKAISQYSQTKQELADRLEKEEQLAVKGTPKPPRWLSTSQAEIFNKIVELLQDTGMLALNDVWLLQQTAIAIDRLEQLEKDINADPDLAYESSVQATRKGYISDFYRGCNELCLSPQARAKFANLTTQKAEDKPVENILKRIGTM